MNTPRILIVDDEIDFANGLARLVLSGMPEAQTLIAHNWNEAQEKLEQRLIPVMLLDLNMPGLGGMDVIPIARKKYPNTTIIVLTAYGTVDTAVAAIKLGAWDFLTKPVSRDDLLHSLSMAIKHSGLLKENQRLKQLMAQSGLEKTLIGESPAMQRLKENIISVAASSYTVLIRGESGTGKELVAEGIHRLSNRHGGPFVRVNCPAIPEQLLESELFGHAKGAFTGAISAHKGLFLQADGGTLLLDEIGDIPLSIQTKLLRALQDGEVRPVGGNKSVRVNARIIAATHQDLEKKIEQGTFREDLFYRLNVLQVQTPALREHKCDIPLLSAHFLSQTCVEMDIPAKCFSPEAMAIITQQDWLGNVRELQNCIRRVAVFSNGDTVQLSDLEAVGIIALDSMAGGQTGDSQNTEQLSYKEAKNTLLDTFAFNYMQDLLRKTGGNVSETARISGLERVSVQKILRRLGLDAASFR